MVSDLGLFLFVLGYKIVLCFLFVLLEYTLVYIIHGDDDIYFRYTTPFIYIIGEM